MAPDRFPTLVELMRWRAAAHPDRMAYRFLPDGERETHRFTYADIDRRARAVAARLQDEGAQGERVLITYPAEAPHHYMESFLGCLYAGAVAVPCDAGRSPSSVERRSAVRRDAEPIFTLGEDIDVAQIPDQDADRWRPPPLRSDSLALLQYTSGSTRRPRGVMVSHGNIMANERAIAEACRHDEDSSFVGWLPLFHDMGMIANALQPVYLGSTSILMPPGAFLAQPVRWLAAISRYRGVTGGGPNFAYDLCVARISEADREGLDLSSWRAAFNGAEVVRAATIRRFTEVFGAHGFAPETFFACYGLAEATLIVSGAPRGAVPRMVRADQEALRHNEIRVAADAGSQALVSSGAPVVDTTVTIRDPRSGALLPPAEVGEIYIHGPGVAGGYWRDDEATALTFPGDRTLRTGDLGALIDGELFVVGRHKDLIVVRGQNHHPADLEWTVERSHRALRPSCGAVVAHDDGDAERIVVIHEAAGDADVDEVAAAIRQAVSQRHGLHVDVVVLTAKGSVLKTTSGKIRRSACRDAWLAGDLPVIGTSVQSRPSTVEAILEQVAAAGVLDSMTAVELQHVLQIRHGIRLPPLALLGDPSAVARAIAESRPVAEAADVEEAGSMGVTAQALWFESELAPDPSAYVLKRVLRIHGPVDMDALRQAIATATERHPALRTSLGGQRARFTLSEGELAIEAHHAVADLWSFGVVIREIQILYGGGALPPVTSTPTEHARREAAMLASPEGERLWAYWRDRLSDAPATLDLPTDRRRPATRSFRGESRSLEISAEVTARLRELARRHRCTLFTVVLAAYQVFLSRLSGQRDFVTGVLASGRDDAALADAVGCFVSTVPVRARVAGSFTEMLERVRTEVLRDLAHSAMPLPEIVRRLAPARSPARPALVQTMLVFQHGRDEGLRALALGRGGRLRSAGLEFETLPVRQDWTHLDLTLNVAEIDGRLVGSVEGDAALFELETLAAFAARFAHLLGQLSGRPDAPVDAHPILTPAERCAAIAAAQGERVELPVAGLHQLVDAVCVSRPLDDGTSEHLSGRALRRWVKGVATQLNGEPRVGILLDRCLGLPVAMLAALESGAAYVPVDPADPRLATLLAGTDVVITDTAHRRLLPEGIRAINVNAHREGRGARRPPPTHPEQPAYVIHTSGSTGTPKGVVVPHRGIVNRLLWMQHALGLQRTDRVLHKTPATFDVSVWEIFWPLMQGATLVIGPPGVHRDPHRMAELMRREEVTVAHMVPSVLAAPLNVPSLRHLVFSGEVLPRSTLDRAPRGAAVWNLYGPTEASIDVTAWRCDRPGEVPIGTPIANVDVYVLSPGLEPQPVGVKGEVHIGGAGLAHGYLGRPARTAEAFVPDPLSGTPGARLYRTGDIGVRRAGGNIVYIGRADDQIKLAGNRIELGEVEAALHGAPGVDAAAAAVHNARLVGYVIGEADLEAVRQHLRHVLPAAHVPAQLQRLEQLPTTPSGKLDRRRLPAPPSVIEPVPAVPQTPAQQRVAECWSTVLGRGDISLDEDFFTAGGDSILALRAVAALRETGIETTVGQLMAGATVRTLAALAPAPTVHDVTLPPFTLCPAEVRQRLPQDVVDAYPVSLAQRAVLFHQMDDARHETYVTTVEVRARFVESTLRAAIAGLLARHAYLRSTFDLTSHREPLQLVHTAMAVALSVGDSEVDVRAERKTPFDVTAGPLIRFRVHPRGEHGFQLAVVSFALDGWCTATVLTELLTDYGARLSGRAAGLSAPPCGYADFVALEREAMHSPATQEFWARELADAQPCRLPSPAARERGEDVSLTRRITVPVAVETAEALRRVGVPLKTLLLAAHLRVVRLMTGRPEVITGLEVNGRPEMAGGDRVIGVFNNIVPLRVRVEGSWRQLVHAADAAQRRIAPHRRYPLARLDRGLFDTMFVYTHFHIYRELSHVDNVELLGGDAPDRTYVPLTAHFNADAATGALRLLLDYDPMDVDDAQARLWAQCYERALRSLATGPEQSCLRDSLLSAGVLRRQLKAGRGAKPAAGDTVHALITAQARRTPDAVAVMAQGVQLTYQALMQRSGRLARALRAQGVGTDTLVALPARRDADLVIAILAVLRAGGAYLPIDADGPRKRAAAILGEAGVRFLIGSALDADLVPRGCVLVSPRAAGDGTLPAAVDPAALAYALPTSGSTGAPKLVGVSHGAVTAYLRWCAAEYRLAAGRTPVHSPITFDLTVTSLLAPLTAGGTVELIAAEALGDALAAGAAGPLKMTPGHFAAVGTQLALSGKRAAVSCVVLGGEALRRQHLAPWRGLLEARIVNEYGPTEATVGCTVHDVAWDFDEDPVPIGRPITGASVYVLDEGLPVPDGVVAELAIGGAGLARGYLGRPGETAARFVPDPFAVGGRVFRSGDRVYRDRDGVLHYVGRADRQLKVRGHRIEPGEIEHELCLHPAVRQAAVVLTRTSGLTGYWVGDTEADGLREWLRDRLPPFMIPDFLLRVPMLPLTARGKVDYAALPDPRGGRRETLIALAARIPDEAARELIRERP
uniref:Long-chain-fatty-acid--CoA ligase n=1 Tax=uncultured bacterium esnapd14 TaxID=1366594 RepID=S5UCM5_9BACT|nr:long-chain-fatty-acid--CoA ligase [uncultured bacterium esnapd14]